MTNCQFILTLRVNVPPLVKVVGEIFFHFVAEIFGKVYIFVKIKSEKGFFQPRVYLKLV
jgi:hypothetical protein